MKKYSVKNNWMTKNIPEYFPLGQQHKKKHQSLFLTSRLSQTGHVSADDTAKSPDKLQSEKSSRSPADAGKITPAHSVPVTHDGGGGSGGGLDRETRG